MNTPPPSAVSWMADRSTLPMDPAEPRAERTIARLAAQVADVYSREGRHGDGGCLAALYEAIGAHREGCAKPLPSPFIPEHDPQCKILLRTVNGIGVGVPPGRVLMNVTDEHGDACGVYLTPAELRRLADEAARLTAGCVHADADRSLIGTLWRCLCGDVVGPPRREMAPIRVDAAPVATDPDALFEVASAAAAAIVDPRPDGARVRDDLLAFARAIVATVERPAPAADMFIELEELRAEVARLERERKILRETLDDLGTSGAKAIADRDTAQAEAARLRGSIEHARAALFEALLPPAPRRDP